MQTSRNTNYLSIESQIHMVMKWKVELQQKLIIFCSKLITISDAEYDKRFPDNRVRDYPEISWLQLANLEIELQAQSAIKQIHDKNGQDNTTLTLYLLSLQTALERAFQGIEPPKRGEFERYQYLNQILQFLKNHSLFDEEIQRLNHLAEPEVYQLLDPSAHSEIKVTPPPTNLPEHKTILSPSDYPNIMDFYVNHLFYHSENEEMKLPIESAIRTFDSQIEMVKKWKVKLEYQLLHFCHELILTDRGKKLQRSLSASDSDKDGRFPTGKIRELPEIQWLQMANLEIEMLAQQTIKKIIHQDMTHAMDNTLAIAYIKSLQRILENTLNKIRKLPYPNWHAKYFLTSSPLDKILHFLQHQDAINKEIKALTYFVDLKVYEVTIPKNFFDQMEKRWFGYKDEGDHRPGKLVLNPAIQLLKPRNWDSPFGRCSKASIPSTWVRAVRDNFSESKRDFGNSHYSFTQEDNYVFYVIDGHPPEVIFQKGITYFGFADEGTVLNPRGHLIYFNSLSFARKCARNLQDGLYYDKDAGWCFDRPWTEQERLDAVSTRPLTDAINSAMNTPTLREARVSSNNEFPYDIQAIIASYVTTEVVPSLIPGKAPKQVDRGSSSFSITETKESPKAIDLGSSSTSHSAPPGPSRFNLFNSQTTPQQETTLEELLGRKINMLQKAKSRYNLSDRMAIDDIADSVKRFYGNQDITTLSHLVVRITRTKNLNEDIRNVLLTIEKIISSIQPHQDVEQKRFKGN